MQSIVSIKNKNERKLDNKSNNKKFTKKIKDKDNDNIQLNEINKRFRKFNNN